ncbi:hypothetical protein [Roseateles sp. YR242]|uniref:hypothetical protein n=1 Tax=Roseateles sp. YR242 TaxID=1855305 RepID=UPI000A7092DB|nr:hypothetical protein [Roseateles sp. YR242]
MDRCFTGIAVVKQCTYAAHMGFFRSFDLAYGNAPGQAKGSENYLPITIFDSREVEREAFEQGIEVGNATGNWANSGFGLYMTNRICRNGGNFFIASGATSMLLTRGGKVSATTIAV